jgi:hypothetical protein
MATNFSGHSHRFRRVLATSGYPPELTVKANRQSPMEVTNSRPPLSTTAALAVPPEATA